MSWTYGDPAEKPLYEVRFLCGDTEEDSPLLSDEEIMFLLSYKANPRQAAVEALKAILAKLSREVDYTIGPESVKASQRYEQFKELLARLKEDNISGHAFPLWEGQAVEHKPIFDIGMHDNGGRPRGCSD